MGKKRLGVGVGVPPDVEIRAVPDTNGRYFAGTDGHIYCFSDARVNANKPRPFRVAESVGDAGYPFVSVVVGGSRKTKAVHTLVCLAFHGPKPSHIHETRHLDGTRDNSKPENLAWGTPAENEADKKRHGRTVCGVKHHSAKLSDEAVRILRSAISAGLWNPVDAAKVFGVSESVIRNAVRGKTWAHV
jgi:hypothetical protein